MAHRKITVTLTVTLETDDKWNIDNLEKRCEEFEEALIKDFAGVETELNTNKGIVR